MTRLKPRARLDPLCGALVRAIRACSSVEMLVEEIACRAWASATFIGARHRFVVTLPGPDPAAAEDRLATLLLAHDFTLRGHIVADVAAFREEGRDEAPSLTIEVLTIEE